MHQTATPDIQVIELRNYLVRPGMTDDFIRYFNQHFVDSQAADGAYIMGRYKVAGLPDRFCWIRGFGNMAVRSRFLPSFYDGPVWKAFGPEANNMMLEWHNVYLLKPVFNPGPIHIHSLQDEKGTTVIRFYRARKDCFPQLLDLFASRSNAPDDQPGSRTTTWITERGENDFIRLPVIQEDNLVVTITSCADEDEIEQIPAYLATTLYEHDLIESIDQLILVPPRV